MTQPAKPAGAPGPLAGPIDSHCHLADKMFEPDVGEVVARVRATGAPTALCILDAGADDEFLRALGVHEMWPAIRFAVGVHPQNADAYRADFNLAAAAVERALTRAPRVCAIGEMGLDYHYDFAGKGLQQQVFRAQVKLAVKHGLPIVVHTREAEQDTIRILKDAGQGRVRGVFHCFTGDAALAAAALELGFYLSFSGIVSFPNSSALRGVAANVPEDRFLIETDSPYLAPVPHRGKRNEPAFVGHVAEALAIARRTTPAAIVQRSAANFAALFGAW
jgi:TatD DNase family protein